MWQYNQSSELMHYGVLGMQWGRRKSPAEIKRAEKKEYGKATEKQLNRLDKEKIRIKDEAYDNDMQRSSNLSRRLAKAEIRGYKPDSRKIKRLTEKSEQVNSRLSVKNQQLEKNKAQTEELVKGLKKKGYTVVSYETQRSAKRGMEIFDEIMRASRTGASADLNYKTGTQYKVLNG